MRGDKRIEADLELLAAGALPARLLGILPLRDGKNAGVRCVRLSRSPAAEAKIEPAT